MLKVVVYDHGTGGQNVADFLAEELKIMEVRTVIDWGANLQDLRTTKELALRAAAFLQPFIGHVDLIVLANYDVGLALKWLRAWYPEQKFVALRMNYSKFTKYRRKRIAVLPNNFLMRHEKSREEFEEGFLKPPDWMDCWGWERIINDDLMTKEILHTQLVSHFGMRKGRARKKVASEIERRSLLETMRTRKQGDAVRIMVSWLENMATRVREERILALKNEGRLAELELLGIMGVEHGRER